MRKPGVFYPKYGRDAEGGRRRPGSLITNVAVCVAMGFGILCEFAKRCNAALGF